MSNSDNDWRGTPEQQAGARRSNGDRRAAQDSAHVLRCRNAEGFLTRFPEARHIQVRG